MLAASKQDDVREVRPHLLLRLTNAPAPASRPSRRWLAECAENRHWRNEPARLLNIAPSGCKAGALAKRWRGTPGLWEGLCRRSLWQGALPSGEPVHDERSAVAAIYNSLGEQWLEFEDWREAALWSCGLAEALRVLRNLGIGRISQSAWRAWRARLEGMVSSQDDDPSIFLDGWPLRLGGGRSGDDESLWLARPDAPKIDIHGKSLLPCLADPDTADNGLRIASLTDILLHKLLALSAREECRDLIDLQALAAEAGADADNAGAAVSSGSWGLDRSEADELGRRLSDLRGWGADSGLRALGRSVLAGLDRAPRLAHRQVQGAL